MPGAENDRGVGASRAAGGWGWAFTMLLLISAGMASVPGGSDADSTVREFYTAHAGVVITAQVISLVASATFVLFTLTLRRGSERRGLGRLEAAGLAVAAASVLTVVPPLSLTVVADSASSSDVHRLAVASDLVDVVLFLTIGAFGGVLAATAPATWFKAVSAVVTFMAVTRAVELLLGSDLLQLAAPLAFIALVVVVSTLVLLRRPPVSPG